MLVRSNGEDTPAAESQCTRTLSSFVVYLSWITVYALSLLFFSIIIHSFPLQLFQITTKFSFVLHWDGARRQREVVGMYMITGQYTPRYNTYRSFFVWNLTIMICLAYATRPTNNLPTPLPAIHGNLNLIHKITLICAVHRNLNLRCGTLLSVTGKQQFSPIPMMLLHISSNKLRHKNQTNCRAIACEWKGHNETWTGGHGPKQKTHNRDHNLAKNKITSHSAARVYWKYSYKHTRSYFPSAPTEYLRPLTEGFISHSNQ